MANRGKVLLALSVLTLSLSAGCAAPVTTQQPEPPGQTARAVPSVPAPAGESLVGGDAIAVAATGPEDAGTVGLSPRTTRGHVWAEPVMDGETVSILVSAATRGDHVHLELSSNGGAIEFMGYFTGGEFFLRANACPSCGAERIEWGGSLIVCRACEAKFDAVTGEGESGGSSYPTSNVPYTLEGDSIVFAYDDLMEAYARTIAGEATLFVMPEVYVDDDRGDRSWPRCCPVR